MTIPRPRPPRMIDFPPGEDAPIVMLQETGPFVELPMELLAWIENELRPLPLGVPVITPDTNDRPVGKVPEEIDQLIGVDPEAVSVCE